MVPAAVGGGGVDGLHVAAPLRNAILSVSERPGYVAVERTNAIALRIAAITAAQAASLSRSLTALLKGSARTGPS